MGFIGIDRGIEDHWIYQDAEYFKVWFEILLRARYSKEPEKKLQDGKFVTIEYGQFMFGRVSWSERLGVSERRIRTLFDKLIKDDMIQVISKHPKFTIYHVVNFAKYRPNFDQQSDQQTDQQQTQSGQGFTGISDQQNDSTKTSKRPTSDQQATTQEQGSNKGNKVNKENKYKELIVEIVNYLNAVTGKKFSPDTKETVKLISGRLSQGRTMEQFKHVIDVKTDEWLGNEKTEGWLKPSTLFAESNFESYVNQKRVIPGGGNNVSQGNGQAGRNPYNRTNQSKSGNLTFSDDELSELNTVNGF